MKINLRGCVLFLMLFLCGICRVVTLAQDVPPLPGPLPTEMPTDVPWVPGMPPTITLTVCRDGTDFVFGYETNEDFVVSEGGLHGIDNEYHWGAVMVFYANPAERIGFRVPAAAMMWETPTDDIPFVSQPEWWIQRYTGEYVAVDVYPDAPMCDGSTSNPVATDNIIPIGTKVIGWHDDSEQIGVIIGYLDMTTFPETVTGFEGVTIAYQVNFPGMDASSGQVMSRSMFEVCDDICQ